MRESRGSGHDDWVVFFWLTESYSVVAFEILLCLLLPGTCSGG